LKLNPYNKAPGPRLVQVKFGPNTIDIIKSIPPKADDMRAARRRMHPYYKAHILPCLWARY